MDKLWFKYIIVILVLFLGLIHPSKGYAAYPEKGESSIVDPYGYYDQTQMNEMNAFTSKLSFSMVTVFLDEVDGDGFTYAKNLFKHYNLGENAILFLVTVADEGKLYYAYDSSIEEQGITTKWMEKQRIDHYMPLADQNKYWSGVESLAQIIEQQTLNTQEENTSSQWMMWGIPVAIILIIVLLSLLMYRKRMLKEVDWLEAWKIKIENRPFSTQLSRVKGLKLSGEVEARFEKWKEDWEKVLITSLPQTEERLLDIEDLLYSFRFVKAKRLIKDTEQKFVQIENTLDQILEELDELTESEEQNRTNIVKLYEQYQEVRKQLQDHMISLGISYAVWDEKLKKAVSWFDEFNQAQENGDYLTANDYVEAIESVFAQVKEAIEVVPNYVKEIEEKIPQKIKEAEQAIQEMTAKDYNLEHTKVEEELTSIKSRQKDAIMLLQQGQLDQLKNWVQTQNEILNQLFDQLEKEVESRKAMISTLEKIPDIVEELENKFIALEKDVNETKHTYAWDDEWEDLYETILQQMKAFIGLVEKIESLEGEKENDLDLRKHVHQLIETKDQLEINLKQLEEILNQVRQEETKAKEINEGLKQKLAKVNFDLRKSNLPGIPQHLKTGMKMADEAMSTLNELLEHSPIEVGKLEHHLQEAKAQVESVSQIASSVIKDAVYAEECIQFANRYRRKHPDIISFLDNAEHAFRSFQYKESVELVIKALDRADKKWREKLEEQNSVG